MARVSLGTDSSGRPLVLDDRTLAKLRQAEKRLGHTFVIVQGSWRSGDGASASAGTHDRGGVIDLRTWDLPPAITPRDAVLELRRAGFVAWYRHEGQGFDPHIHAIDRGNPDLDPSAARQVTAWEQGRNGLASNGPDDGPHVPIPTDPPKPQEDFDMDKNEARDLFAAVIRDEVPDALRGAKIDLGDGKKRDVEQVLKELWQKRNV